LHGEEGLDLRLLAGRLWAGRWWIVVSVVLFTAIFAAAAFLMTPVYRATTVLVPVSTERGGAGSLGSALGQLGGLAALAGIMGDGGSQTDEALAVLVSREFTEGFIHDHNLMPELFHGKWDEATGRWRGDKADWPTPALAFKVFDEDIRAVVRDKKTGLITVTIEWRDRAKAALWTNELVARLNAEMRARAIASTNASVGYLQNELAATSTIDTRSAITRLMEAQINQRMFANVTQEYSLRVVDRALPPDPKDVVRPKKLLLVALGPALGLLFGAAGVLGITALLTSWRREG
jgi:uncharacterized protein involved in exopolysaccharide biosynthesis